MVRHPVCVEGNRAVRRIRTRSAGDPHGWRSQSQIAETSYSVCTVPNVSRSNEIATEEIAYALIGKAARTRTHLAGQSITCRFRLQVDIGGDVEGADAFDPIVVDPTVDRTGIETCRHIREEDDVGVYPIGTDAHVVGKDARPLDRDIAIQPYVCERAPCDSIEPGYAGRSRFDRDKDSIRIDLSRSAGNEIDQAHVVHHKAIGIQRVTHIRCRKLSVETQLPAQSTTGQVLGQGGRLQQRKIDTQIAEGAFPEIDQTAGIQAERVARESAG